MSAKVFGKVWELEIDPIEKLVLLALADHADHEGNNVRPGNKLLCAKTGLSERTIGLKIADFIKQGILLPVRTTTGRGNIREFSIDVDAIPRNKYFIEKERLKVEARSTFKPQERSKPDQPLEKNDISIKVEADDIKVEVEGSPYKEGTVKNLIGDIHIPQTPSEVNLPKAENLLATQIQKLPLPAIVEPNLANPPQVDQHEYAAASAKEVTPYQRMVAALSKAAGGRKILNWPTQGKAINKILTGYSADEAIEVLEWMADPKSWWKGNVDWVSAQNQMPGYFARKAQQQPPQEPKSNGNGFSTTTKRDYSRIIANLPEHLR